MKLMRDQPAVAVQATGWEDLEELRDEHVRIVEERCGGGLEGLVPRRRAPAPVVSSADGGSR
jgi:hypothetical protein